MWPRGEVGAGVLVRPGLRHRRAIMIVAMLSLAVNLL